MGSRHVTRRDASQTEDQVGHGRCGEPQTMCPPHFISNPVTLNQVLEANDIGDGFLGEPYKVFITWYFVFFSDLEATSIACHVKSIQSLDYL